MKIVQAHEKDGDFGNEWLKTNSAGSGPTSSCSWKAERQLHPRAVTTATAGPRPLPQRVVVRHVAEPATQRLLLEKGDIDIARNLTKDQLDAIKRQPEHQASQQAPKGSIFYLGLNQKNPSLAKPEVREALK